MRVERKPAANLGTDEQEPDKRPVWWEDPAANGEVHKPNGHPVDPTAIEGRISVLPWEISSPLQTSGAGGWRQSPTDEEKSAEAIVARNSG